MKSFMHPNRPEEATSNRRALLGFLLAGGASTALPSLAVPARHRLAGIVAAREHFPNVELLDQSGRRLRFVDDVLTSASVVVINMMYAQCTNICPPNTANLIRVRDALGKRFGRDIAFISLTLRPEVDRPGVLLDYAKQYKTGPGWSFLTGHPVEIEALRRSMGFYDRDPELEAQIARHTGMALVGAVARDRWTTVPTLATVSKIVHTITHV